MCFSHSCKIMKNSVDVKNKLNEAVNFLYDIPRFTTKNSPQHTKDFLALLGSPQDSFPTIHVAGSNGKGSVCKFLYEILRKMGMSVGLFTSPHLVDIRERFLIDGQMCSVEAFLQAYETTKKAAEKQQELSGAYPTFFEFVFAMGMVLFKHAGVQLVVLETGLGGRLDATNSVTAPLACVITSISLEHTEYLGDTIQQIAGEKAGIIKPGVPVIYDANDASAAAVIAKVAKEQGSYSLGLSKNNFQVLEIKRNLIDFSLTTQYDKHTSWQVASGADYQVMNACLAITCIRVLQQIFAADKKEVEDVMRSALATAKWPGRFEEVLPEVILDGAHNVGGITEFVKNVDRLTKQEEQDGSVSLGAADSGFYQKPILLFSMVKDKDYHRAIRLLAGLSWDSVYVTTIPGQRGIPAAELQQIFAEENNLAVESIEDYKEAFDTVIEKKKAGQRVFCTGSLYFVGAILEHLKK